MLKVAQASGATHLIYGTLSDIRTRENHFKGYGIETHTINYDMDVIAYLVEILSGKTLQEYLKEADYYSRHQNQDKAKTYIRWANEASDKAKLRTTWANDAREKAQLRMKWAREAMEKAKK